jgi:hypothetical protein
MKKPGKKSDPTLGSISGTQRDQKLSDGKALPTQTHRKVVRPPLEKLKLPRGAFVAFRASGGIRFKSREIVIYPDGRMTSEGTHSSSDEPARGPRSLGKAELAEIHQSIEKAGLYGISTHDAQQPPDSIAYEIAAREASRSNYVQAFEGIIPDGLMPLIRLLSGFLP